MNQTAAQSHRMPLVFNDLSHRESVEDVIYTLEHLAHIVDEIFTRIDTRINEEKTRVSSIKSRVNACEQKVQKIKGSNRAITVFSTAKFPAPKKLPSYPTLFGHIIEKHSPIRDIAEDVRYLPASDYDTALGNTELTADLNDIITRINSTGTELQRVEMIMEDHGLGPIPQSMSSIGSIMLFNSNINLYEGYQTLDNLVTAGREKTAQEEKNKGLASAPTTIANGDALPDVHALDLLFKPQMGEMSSLGLPENLPLDFIANIQFDQRNLPSIAPSMNAKPNYSLPQITYDGPSAKQPKPAAGSASAPPPPPTSSGPPPPPPSSSGPPPPPPPPSGGAPPPPPPPSMPSMSAPPPPPPGVPMPPPAPAAPIAPVIVSEFDIDETDNSSRPSAPPAGNPRASLLDSIKGMGVDKLRSKEESAMQAKKVQKKVEEKKPLTMQDALKERLARRNNAISGKSDKEAQRRDSVVIQQARESMIVPPSSKPKPSLAAFGFASVEDVENNSDGDSIPKFKPTATRRDNDDSDSDSAVSELSFESKVSIKPPTTMAPPIAPPSRPIAPPPPAAPFAPPIPPQSDGGGGLLSANNPALASLLKKASNKKGDDSDSDEGGGDDEWDD